MPKFQGTTDGGSWSLHHLDKLGTSPAIEPSRTSNKWVKIIFKIWKDEILFDETKKITPAAWHRGCVL